MERAKRTQRTIVLNELPQFVALGFPEGTKLRLVGDRYVRDAGAWSIAFKETPEGLVASCEDSRSELKHVDGQPLYLSSHDAWAKDNGSLKP